MCKHVPMSLIRDEDRCLRITGRYLLYLLSLLVTIVAVLVLCACNHCVACFLLSIASPSPLCSHWAVRR